MMQLRRYQREAIDETNEWFGRYGGNPLIVIPTAGGKSLILAAYCQEALATFPATRILVVTHVKELIVQNFDELVGIWPAAPAGIYSAGLKRRELDKQITFAGIQSIHSRVHHLGHIDLVFVDEAHLVPRSDTTRYIQFLRALKAQNPWVKVVGLTATPFRLDSGRLDKGKDAIFSAISYEASIVDLINEGYLCRPTTRRGRAQIDTSQVGTRGGEFIPGQLEQAALDPEVTRSIAQEIVDAGRDRKGWLVFGCGIAHAEVLAEALEEHGISCATIFGHTPAKVRRDTIAAFKRQEIRALIAMQVLTTGFNAPHVDLIALARPTKSVGLYIQIVGRGTRLYQGKEDCLLLDFGGNVDRHGPIDTPVVKTKQEGGGAAPIKLCPDCGHENALSARTCEYCGHEFPPPERKVNTIASRGAVLSSDIEPEWVDVSDVHYRAHNKIGKPPSLCVTYRSGLSFYKEWVTLEHGGYPRLKAEAWWLKRAPGRPVPATVAEALPVLAWLPKPSRIAVRPAGKYTEIVAVAF